MARLKKQIAMANLQFYEVLGFRFQNFRIKFQIAWLDFWRYYESHPIDVQHTLCIFNSKSLELDSWTKIGVGHQNRYHLALTSSGLNLGISDGIQFN